MASSGKNIHIELKPVLTDAANLAKVNQTNMSELKDFYNMFPGIGGTYMIYKKVKLNDNEKNFLLTNYSSIYNQEQ